MTQCESRLDALYRLDSQWIDGLKRRIAVLEYQQAAFARSLISGSEMTILGKRISAGITWPDGRPYGLTDEEILEAIPLPPLPGRPV